MRLSKSAWWRIVTVVALLGLPFIYYNFILDRHPPPFCHKQIYFAFHTWMVDSKTNAFPNAGGIGADSISLMNEQMGGLTWSKNYKYVPGLCVGDPGDLVLMYVAHPTRWTWHGSTPTIFRQKQWILVPLDFKSEGPDRAGAGPGELSERVSSEEFRRRLQRTLDFLRTNTRPNWETVVAEHARFLESVGPEH